MSDALTHGSDEFMKEMDAFMTNEPEEWENSTRSLLEDAEVTAYAKCSVQRERIWRQARCGDSQKA